MRKIVWIFLVLNAVFSVLNGATGNFPMALINGVGVGMMAVLLQDAK